MRSERAAVAGSRRREAFRGPRGFTLAEMVIAVLIVSVLGAVLVPHLVDTIRGGQAAALARNLDALSEAVTDFRGDIGRYPSRLTYLTTQPTTGATDTCGRGIGVDWSSDWKGPYLQIGVGATGIVSGDATIQDAVEREPSTFSGGNVAVLLIHAVDVDRAIADQLEASIDGNDDLTAGTIRWVDAGTDRGTLSFALPIRGC